MWYKLINRKPVPFEHDIQTNEVKFKKEFKKFYRNFRSRKVRSTYIGEIRVSTAFTGINNSISVEHSLLFETMVFGGENKFIYRCSTWRQALKQHQLTIKMVRERTPRFSRREVNRNSTCDRNLYKKNRGFWQYWGGRTTRAQYRIHDLACRTI
jgi:hypothetical protein